MIIATCGPECTFAHVKVDTCHPSAATHGEEFRYPPFEETEGHSTDQTMSWGWNELGNFTGQACPG